MLFRRSPGGRPEQDVSHLPHGALAIPAGDDQDFHGIEELFIAEQVGGDGFEAFSLARRQVRWQSERPPRLGLAFLRAFPQFVLVDLLSLRSK